RATHLLSTKNYNTSRWWLLVRTYKGAKPEHFLGIAAYLAMFLKFIGILFLHHSEKLLYLLDRYPHCFCLFHHFDPLRIKTNVLYCRHHDPPFLMHLFPVFFFLNNLFYEGVACTIFIIREILINFFDLGQSFELFFLRNYIAYIVPFTVTITL